MLIPYPFLVPISRFTLNLIFKIQFAHWKQNILRSISELGSILGNVDCSAQKTNTETGRNITDMRLYVPIIIDRNNVTPIL